MSKDDIKKGIVTCCQNVGIMVACDNLSDDFDIQEYIEDSVMFITLIIELENYFNIDIPDEYLLPETISSLGALTDMISKLIS